MTEDRCNTPMAWQLTVGELRRLLADVPDEAVVGLAIPGGTRIDRELTTYFTPRVARASGIIVVLEPLVVDELTTSLFDAIRSADIDEVTRALARGADVRSRDPTFGADAETPLIAAASCGQDAVVKLLLSRGADVNVRSGSGWTALMRACNAGHIECARLLLAAGADPNLRNDEGYSALGRIAGDVPELIELLKSHGGSP